MYETIRDILVQHCGWNSDIYQQFRDLLAIHREPSPSLRDILDNHAAVSRMNPLPLGTTPCACHEGPFKSYYDASVGHVLTYSSTILEPLHPLLSKYGVGFNYRFYPDPSSNAIYTAIRNFWADIGSAADEFIRVHHSETIFDRNKDTIMSHLKAGVLRRITNAALRTRFKMNREHIPCPTDKSYIRHMHKSLMVTCLDKVGDTPCYMCIHLAAQLIHARSSEPAFCILDHGALSVSDANHLDVAQCYGLTQIQQRNPTLYPTLKAHKCMLHDPAKYHECGLAWRFITSAYHVTSSHTGDIVTAILQATKHVIDRHRDMKTHSYRLQHGLHMRFRFGVSCWQSVALSMPDDVPSSYCILTGDLKRAFENIPLDGPDGLDKALATHISEAYTCVDKDIFIPVSADGRVLAGSKFCAYPGPPPYGGITRWIHIDLQAAMNITIHYAQSTVIDIGEHSVLQTIGIPMGGSPCSLYCDLYLDHYEHRLACVLATVCSSRDTPFDQITPLHRHCHCIRKWMLHYYRYCDDVFTLAPLAFTNMFNPHDQRDEGSATWLYPLTDSIGNTIMSFEPGHVQSDDGTHTDNFLCLTITLGLANDKGRRPLSFIPYNKTDGFLFHFPKYTHWTSHTAHKHKRNILLCMMTYAIIGSSEVQATITFITSVINRLRLNLYPIQVLRQMWHTITKAGTLKQLPCHIRIHRKITMITHEVNEHINRLQ